MFVRNFEDISKKNIILVDSLTKDYLLSLGYCTIGCSNGKWGFNKTNELINILSQKKGGQAINDFG